ncbi:MAG: hypothetical protein H8E28_13955 [Anaerolineae bacterium]|nr:hypothetical protein [Anaerolineae bacterium]
MNKLKHTLLYLHLLSFTPPEKVADLQPLRDSLGEDWPRSAESAVRLIVSFQQASRNPESELVSELARLARSADSSPEACRAFQTQMDTLAQLPGRAKPEHRLHRKRGCQLCATPCRYGYFSLVTEPNFEGLPNLLEAQTSHPVQAVWQFTLTQLAETFNADRWHISAKHLGNLSYCLVALATAKSRYPFPEEQMRKFQAMNQSLIEQYR